jgi:hypothetical protein
MKNIKQFVSKYVTDQLALEAHTLSVIDVQLKDPDLIEMSPAVKTLTKVRAMLESHVAGLRELSDSEADQKSSLQLSASLTETLTDVTGTIIGLYNKLRTEKVSKMLRDDYTALHLSALTYSMLFTTAKGLGEMKTAELAAQHLQGIPPLIMELNSIIPSVVLIELRKVGFSVQDAGADSEAVEQSTIAWKRDPQVGFGSPTEIR